MSEKSPFKNQDFRPGLYKKKTPEKKISYPGVKEIKRNRKKGRKGYTFMGNQI